MRVSVLGPVLGSDPWWELGQKEEMGVIRGQQREPHSALTPSPFQSITDIRDTGQPDGLGTLSGTGVPQFKGKLCASPASDLKHISPF